jgi:DNA-directed RNA polymerase subunit alpha
MNQQTNNFISCLDSRIQQNNEFYARFHLGNFITGQALTVANSLRRTLLSEVPAFVITKVHIQGVSHEFSTIPGVQENVLTILLNLKRLVLVANKKQVPHEFTATLNIRGPKKILAGDINFPLGISPVNPYVHIASLNSTGEFNLSFKIQYIDPTKLFQKNLKKSQPLSSQNELILDTNPKPIKQVNFGIYPISSNHTSEYISLEIWTNGSITPHQALEYSLEKLTGLFYNFSKLSKSV